MISLAWSIVAGVDLLVRHDPSDPFFVFLFAIFVVVSVAELCVRAAADWRGRERD